MLLGQSDGGSGLSHVKQDKGGRSSDGVRALERGLAILRFVNAAGDTKPAEIAAALDIPRSSVYRLLQTLEEQGYVVYSPTSARVRVSRLAAGLGDGFARTSLICQAAGPIFGEYAPQLVWPLDLSIYDNAAMVVQETTHDRSPLSIDRGMTGFRLPVLRSSAGRAYIAHCRQAERELILNHIRRLDDPDDIPFMEPEKLAIMLTQVRRRGLAVRDSGPYRPKTSSIAVPVMVDGDVLACVSMIWIRTAMTLQEAIGTYEEPMREIADRVAHEVQVR